MKKSIAMLLMLVGGAVIVLGILLALRALAGLYEANTTNAMTAPDNLETQTASEMKRGAIIGAAGVPLLLAGSFMWKRARRKVQW